MGREVARHLFWEALGWGVGSLAYSGIEYFRGKQDFEKGLHHPETFVLPAPAIVAVGVEKPPPPEKWWQYIERSRAALIVTSEDDHGARETYTITPMVAPPEVLGQFIWLMRFTFELGYFNMAGLSLFLPELIPEYLSAFFNDTAKGSKLRDAVEHKIQQALPARIQWNYLKIHSFYHVQRLRRVKYLDRIYAAEWKILDSESDPFQPLCYECGTFSPARARICANCSKPLC